MGSTWRGTAAKGQLGTSSSVAFWCSICGRCHQTVPSVRLYTCNKLACSLHRVSCILGCFCHSKFACRLHSVFPSAQIHEACAVVVYAIALQEYKLRQGWESADVTCAPSATGSTWAVEKALLRAVTLEMLLSSCQREYPASQTSAYQQTRHISYAAVLQALQLPKPASVSLPFQSALTC